MLLKVSFAEQTWNTWAITLAGKAYDPTRRKWMLSNRLNLLQHANSCAVS
jgi:hypothetical protein